MLNEYEANPQDVQNEFELSVIMYDDKAPLTSTL